MVGLVLEMKTAAIIQARMGSTRFHGKVMAHIGDKTVIERVIERSMEIGLDDVILALPWPSNELYEIAQKYKIKHTFGPEHDVLKSYFMAANAHHVDIIMRITADCPFIQPNLCRQVLELYNHGGCELAAIGWPQGGFPKGYGCEIFSAATLDRANNHAIDPYDREHVTTWMEANLRTNYLQNSKDESHLNYCIDYPEDIARLEKLFGKCGPMECRRNKITGQMCPTNQCANAQPEKLQSQGALS